MLRNCLKLWYRRSSIVHLGLMTTNMEGFGHRQLKTIFIPVKAGNHSGSQSIRNEPFAYFAFGGLLSSLGLTNDEEEKNPMSKGEQQIVNTIKMAVLAQQEGLLAKAEQLLHVALRTAQELVHVDAETYIYDALANLALESGDTAKAEKLLQSVAQRLVSAHRAKDDNAFLEVSLKLASVYAQTPGKSSEAESGFHFCLENLQKKLRGKSSKMLDEEGLDTTMLLAMAADAYGRHLMTQKRHTEAVEAFSKALEALRSASAISTDRSSAESSSASLPPQALVVVNNLGSANSMRGHHEEAVQWLKTAVEMAREMGRTEDLAAFHRNLGIAYVHMGRFVEAEAACRESLRESKNNPEYSQEAQKCFEIVREVKKTASQPMPSAATNRHQQ